ncbi:hypothetical protein MAR_012327, partial [Mya arenaria]
MAEVQDTIALLEPDRNATVLPGTVYDAISVLPRERKYVYTTIEDCRKMEVNPVVSIKRRSSGTSFDRCIICQEKGGVLRIGTVDGKKRIREVSEIRKSLQDTDNIENDNVMRVRLAGVNDLIASEGKYRLKCLSKFRRKSITIDTLDEPEDEVMKELKHVLEEGFSRGHVYDMNTVWSSYCRRKQESGKSVPSKYQTRKQSFYEDVKRTIGEKGQLVRPLDKQSSLLLYPACETNKVISQTLTKESRKQFETFLSDSGSETDTSGDDSVVLELPCENTILQEIVHAALKIRTDLNEMPGHDSICSGFDDEHIEKIIPDSLYIFLRLLFGGMALLDGDDDAINASANRK